MSTYERVKHLLADGEWHSMEELKTVCMFPERWVEELRRDGLEIKENEDESKVALVGAGA
jgi:hypothetical protein